MALSQQLQLQYVLLTPFSWTNEKYGTLSKYDTKELDKEITTDKQKKIQTDEPKPMKQTLKERKQTLRENRKTLINTDT